MRKNKMMRAASALLVAVLLTTSTISGTFAKYVTTASGSDVARVAKWGVQLDMSAFSDETNGLFAKTYAKDGETSITNTVVAEEKVVAPGTKNENGITFKLTGTPEVATKVEIKVTNADASAETPIDVFLKAGTYKDWTRVVDGDDEGTDPSYETTFTVAEYHPIIFTLYDGTTKLSEGSLATIEAFLEAANKDYAPGTNLATILGGTTGEYKLTWRWAFEQTEKELYDKADTLLGQIAAGVETSVAAENYSTKIEFAIEITVTQID